MTKLTLILLSLFISGSAYARQLISHAEQTHQHAVISLHEQNRLAVQGRRIASVIPPQKGVFSFIKDEALGALYFTLTDSQAQSVTLFVSDDKGVTYKLILQPNVVPGADIVLQPPKTSASKGVADNYVAQVKALMASMAQTPPEDSSSGPREVKLWQESQFMLLGHYSEEGLLGEKYVLKNISPAELTLAEPEFYRPGVIAVAIERHTLAAGESTHVFVVREE